MLNPTDYAAYSRATGRPYPQSDEERAEMYGEVRNFRNSQLKGGLNLAKQDLGGAGVRRAADNEFMSDMNRLQKSLGEANAIETKLQRRNMPGVFQNQDNAVDTGVGELESSNNIAIGAAVLGGLGLATAAGRRAMANRRVQKAASSTGGRRGGVDFQDNPPAAPKEPSGGGGSGGAMLPEQTKAGVYERVKRSYPDIPGEKELNRAYAPEARRAQQHADKFGYGELRPSERKLTDPRTGEIFERGRSPDIPRSGEQPVRSQQARQAMKDVNNRVDQLLSDVSVGEAGEMLAGPEVAAEARQMSGTESSRQSAAVRRLEKKEESLAKNILSELAAETPAQVEVSTAGKLKKAGLSMAGAPGEIELVDDAMRYSSLDSPYAQSRLNQAGLTEAEVTDYWTNKLKSQGLIDSPTLTETYEAVGEPAARIQNIDALNTAADQAAAPIERVLQRNEDVDVGMAQRFLNDKREKLEGQGLSPTRVERVLASDPATAEAAELYASTGDEAVLSRFSEQPASPVSIKAKGASKLDEVPTKELFQKAPFGEFVDDLEGKDIDLTNRISELGAEQQQLVGRKKQLEEDSLMIRSAMDREKPGEDAYSQMYGKMQYELQNMPEPASLNVDIGDAMAERDNVRAQLKGLQEVGAQQFLADRTEGMRIGYQVDVEGKPIPGTEMTRSYRPSIEQTKTGGGRRVAEFTAGQREPDGPQEGRKVRNYDEAGNQRTDFTDDRTVQAKKTVYGLQTPDEVISAGLRPSRIPQSSVVEEGLRQSVAAPEGDVPIPPPEEVLFVREKPQRSQDPLKASEAIRRARIEGDRRDPQAILRSMGFGV